jgi:type III secretory pathway component EscV
MHTSNQTSKAGNIFYLLSCMKIMVASTESPLITFQMLQHIERKFHAYVINGSREKQIFRLAEILQKLIQEDPRQLSQYDLTHGLCS